MAISTYSELKTAISDWMARSDVSGSAADFITLGEARLNRLLEVVATMTTLSGVVDSATIDISALSMVDNKLAPHFAQGTDLESGGVDA